LNVNAVGFHEAPLPPLFNFFREWPNPVTKYTSSLLVDIDNDGDRIIYKYCSGATTEQHTPVVLLNNGGGIFQQSPDRGYPSYVPYSYFPDNGYYGGYDNILGTYFAFVVDFTHYISTGVVGGQDVLRIAEIDMVHP
jgi:hypothetical protein